MAAAIIPVVHIDRGAIVDPDGSARTEPTKETVRRLAKEHGQVYVVDREGIKVNRPDVALLQDLARRSTLWVDGGARDATDLMDAFIAGADRATLRWRLLNKADAIAKAAALTDRAALAVEFDQDGFMRSAADPSPLDRVLRLASTEQLDLVVIDHAHAGTQKGVRREVAHEVRSFSGDKYYAGGISGRRDLDVLGQMGFSGALVSTAVLEGQL